MSLIPTFPTSERQATLAAAYAAYPERFVNKLPAPPALPVAVWINKPKEDHEKRMKTDVMAESPESTEVLSQKRAAFVAVGKGECNGQPDDKRNYSDTIDTQFKRKVSQSR